MFFKQCVAVYVFLERADRHFMLRRAGTGFMDGYWTVPSGKVDEGEEFLHAAIREVKEEAGIHLSVEELALCHVLHRFDPSQKETGYWIDLFFKANDWSGEPYNAEPLKADRCLWADLVHQPQEIVLLPYLEFALGQINQGKTSSSYGFGKICVGDR